MKRQDYLHIIFFLLMAGSVLIIYQPISKSQTDFYNNLWAPAHLLVQGKSPYYTMPLNTDLPALWMPSTVGFFSFLGFFSFDVAQQVWFFLNISGLAILLYISISNIRTVSVLGASVFLAYFFPPTINHFALGQISILSALCLLGAAKLIEKKPWLSSFLLVLGMAKPQIGFLILFGLSVYQFRTGGLKVLFSYGAKVALSTLILTFPLFIAEPTWIPDFIASLKSNTPEWIHPSILSQLKIWIGNWAYLLWGGILTFSFWLITQIWKKDLLHTTVLWTLAFTVLITPYVWSWDFVLLLPIFIYTFSIASWKDKILLFIGYCCIWAGFIIIQTSQNFHNSRFWWAPLALITVSIVPYVLPKIKNKGLYINLYGA